VYCKRFRIGRSIRLLSLKMLQNPFRRPAPQIIFYLQWYFLICVFVVYQFSQYQRLAPEQIRLGDLHIVSPLSGVFIDDAEYSFDS
jgi:hypothetical protein